MDYRAIVERHFGKHTGLQHSAKACLNGMLAMEAAGAAGGVKFGPAEPEGSGGNRPAPGIAPVPTAESKKNDFEI
ncbi:hypothetical protein [Bradyrhizobium sp. USDA 3256]